MISSSTCGSSWLHSDTESCADRPPGQTCSRSRAVGAAPTIRHILISWLIDWLTCWTYLLSSLDTSAGADDDLVLLFHSHHLSDAVWRAWVVDVPVNYKPRPLTGEHSDLSYSTAVYWSHFLTWQVLRWWWRRSQSHYLSGTCTHHDSTEQNAEHQNWNPSPGPEPGLNKSILVKQNWIVGTLSLPKDLNRFTKTTDINL